MKKKPSIWIRKPGVKNVKFARVLGQKGKLSQYQKQFQTKQAIKAFYGNISEKTFKQAYLWNDSSNQFNILERRLDVLIFRMGLSNSVKESRYLIKSGLVKVNGKDINRQAYNYHVSIGSAIEVSNSCDWARLANTLGRQTPGLSKQPAHIKLGSKLKIKYMKKESIANGPSSSAKQDISTRVSTLVQKYKKSSIIFKNEKSLAFLLSSPEDSKVYLKI